MPAMENVALWHERDISHSSVERVIAPDATALLDFALVRMTRILDELVVYPENMRRNLEQTRGLPFSQTILLSLIKAGLSRQAAYKLVQSVAMRSFEEGLDFKEEALADARLSEHLSHDEIASAFDLDQALSRIDAIFARVFGD